MSEARRIKAEPSYSSTHEIYSDIPVEVQFRHMHEKRRVLGVIDQLTEKFAKYPLAGAKATVVIDETHHKESRGVFQVKVRLFVPGERLYVARSLEKTGLHDGVYGALADCFESIEMVDPKQAEPVHEGRVFVPATDIYEKDDAILVRFDMPGVALDQVDIHLDNTELEISGTQRSGKPEGVDLMAGEYDTGTFRRKFTIPQRIDRDRIRARLRNGVLDIELPKAEQAKPRKIEITTGS